MPTLTSNSAPPLHPFVHLHGGVDRIADAVHSAARPGRLHMISDSVVAPLYGRKLESQLSDLGRDTSFIQFDAGEASKNLSTVSHLWGSLLSQDIDRHDTVVAVGGGVVGDLAGFAASTVLRGIDVIQVPTTVLAMVDASIGGKTGFNVAAGKNLVGSFHLPAAVVCWMESLQTLDDRQYRTGLAEVVKSALLSGESAFSQLEVDAPLLAGRDSAALDRAVELAASLKLQIVAADRLEHGKRAWLNLGHTFAHAIEHATGYGTWTHGEAVSAGLVLALQFSNGGGLLSASTVGRTVALLDTLGLPTAPPRLTPEAWMVPLRHDKKRSGDVQRMVLLRELGEPVIADVGYEKLERWLRATTQAPTLSAQLERRLL